VFDRPLNTAAEGLAIAGVIEAERFVLVTSAFHMPRAMAEMHKRGLQPIPAPTAQRYDPTRPYRFMNFVPGGGALRRSEFAMHEYLGLLALRLGVGG
jgi:uncharacterized SAM-binding protein YcdF (DUF218 family)